MATAAALRGSQSELDSIMFTKSVQQGEGEKKARTLGILVSDDDVSPQSRVMSGISVHSEFFTLSVRNGAYLN